ncbi:MAG TPA: exodeoxyribonuclease VII small subunit [Acidimicrobiales bacterium]|jgi:exodeoxyribonuclease VII small subunit
MARGTEGGAGDPVTNSAAVAELTYSAAGQELDTIIEEFEAGVIDVDRLVERLERATEIVDELDRRLRRTRMQVEELVPRLERIGRPDASGTEEGEGERGIVVEEVYVEESEVDVEFEDEDEDDEQPPGLF